MEDQMRVKNTIAVALALLAVSANAADGWSVQSIGVHLASYHFPQNDFENVNPGLSVRLHNGATFGAYRNSIGRLSAYAGWTWDTDFHGWRPAITAGVVTGYERADVMPLLVPSISTPAVDGFRARFTFVPQIEKGGASAVHLSIERDF